MVQVHRRTPGFTLVELLIVIGILAVLMGLILPAVLNGPIIARERTAQVQMKTLAMSATSYLSDWGDFPSFDPAINTSNRSGAELLYALLCEKHAIGERSVGPYMPVNESNLHTGPGMRPALMSPQYGFYSFGFEGRVDNPVQWVIVDPGRDKLLGGTIDNVNGFRPDNTDANGDGQPDHLDNHIEKASLR